MTTKQILIKARELLSEESRWTKGSFARQADKVGTGANNPLAVCWCALGAIDKVIGDDYTNTDATKSLESAANVLGYASVNALNDRASHSKVLEMFDNAIASQA